MSCVSDLTYPNPDVLGEFIREDITEDEPGVPVTINGQFIDVNTCEPIPQLYWDMWQ